MGGLVKANSIKHNPNTFLSEFVFTDLQEEIVIEYKGILPDMFQEGAGAVAGN